MEKSNATGDVESWSDDELPNSTPMEVDGAKSVDKGQSSSGPSKLDHLAEDVDITKVDPDILRLFFRDVSRSFFDEYGLISHQINSYNEFVSKGIQALFDSLGEIVVEPGYDPSKKSEIGWRHASFKFGKVTLEEPSFWGGGGDKPRSDKLFPRHARLQNLTYAARMKVEVTLQVFTVEIMKSDKYKSSKGESSKGESSKSESGKAEYGKTEFVNKKVLVEEKRDVVVGRLPVMVKSNLCWLHQLDKSDCLFDCGGYFLIKGMEKTFIAQERRCFSKLWVSETPVWKVAYYMSEYKRTWLNANISEPSKEDMLDGGLNLLGRLVINTFFLYTNIPVWILFFALGASSDKEVFEMIDLGHCDANLTNIILDTITHAEFKCKGFRKGEIALQYVHEQIKKTKFPPGEPIDECITKYLFPTLEGFKKKAFFLGYMVKKLLLSFCGKWKCNNWDSFSNKRLELAGDLLARELRSHIRHAERLMVKAMQRDLYGERDLKPIEFYLDASVITNGLNKAFSTGAWCHPFKRMERCSGVVATLRRTNPIQMTSDLRKLRQQVNYAGKGGDARYPNPSYWGKVCFISTPDGENCGLVKNLAATGLISTDLTEPTLDILISCGMEVLDTASLSSLSGKGKVFLNGLWVGLCVDSNSFVTKLRIKRRSKLISPQVEIKNDKHEREVRIFSDAGRILRPLLVVENLKKMKKFRGDYSFQCLLDEAVVELIGVEEEEDCHTAWEIKDLYTGDKDRPLYHYTHCELDPSFLLGLSCGIIPFANHDFAKRVLMQAEKHSQQAIGFSTTNPNLRVDTLSHQLYYPQKPLFRTMLSDSLGKPHCSLDQSDFIAKPEFFNGQNAIVAVNVHQGYNQEDSLVMNRTSLERGMFRTEHFRSYKTDVDNSELLPTKRLKVKDKVDFGKTESKLGPVDSLENDGFPYIGASLRSGDIVIGKVAESGADHSIKLKHTEKGMVQKVVLSANDDGRNYAVVTLRQVRSPCLGDKFSSMHGQKGVVGFLESQENFPFTLQGIVPDIVINPHAFPTRQTPGQLLEAALGKGIACGGSVRYATPFTTASFDIITEQLHSVGFSRWGGERVISGRNGELMRAMIFMGPTFYQRLVHMAEDKVKLRNTGPVHPLTRQPVADRKRFGGVKFGEMERDCLLAHGASANLHERLFRLSDFSHMYVCQGCTRVANVIQRSVQGSGKVRGPYCRFCGSAENIVKINVPYGAKLLYQELFSMGICLKFETEVG
ncbi:DNA-directed RNA polymerase D subunit 2a [Acorus calamus]|uniref:DNA-directed RNA polymerase subunit beta n=1 Tax=Acorus calamus TaxID=4465 RepID=A0AAV9E8W0_ACOCL|nr:DNA-directed RNA polymerase D subunit 2a [Acorus calamus]